MVLVLRRFVGFLVALLILFEEWGWLPLQALLARRARLPPLAWLEQRIAGLPPYPALAVLLVPALALLPLKLMALGLIAHGHTLMGLLLIASFKLAGTALIARLFVLTQPALLRLAWFARWYGRWLAWKTALLARVRASPMWHAASRMKRELRERWRQIRR